MVMHHTSVQFMSTGHWHAMIWAGDVAFADYANVDPTMGDSQIQHMQAKYMWIVNATFVNCLRKQNIV